jgi:hypothetical protein
MTQLSSHSADVQIWLDCGVHGRVDLSRESPRSVVAKAPHEIPACVAELVVSVDGRCRRTLINLRGFTKGRLAAVADSISDVAPF